MRVIVSGMVSATPGHGGATWAVLQYLLGLKSLGHDVHLVEPVDAAALGESASYCAEVMSHVGLESRWCLVTPDGQTAGATRQELTALARGADLLINIAGMLEDEEVLESIPVRAYLDLDPGFVQLWHQQGVDMRFAAHTHHVTLGHGLGTARSPVPDCGIRWIATHQPVALDWWPQVTRPPAYGATTVGNWRSYGSVEHDGVHYGQKAHSVRQLLDLPRRAPLPVEVAFAIDPGDAADLELLVGHDWRLLDPAAVAGDITSYADFVSASTVELAIAKSGYVAARCGWFSDRSVCYLAAGRPVVAQDTGFGLDLPVGEGLLSFTDVDGAVAALDTVMADYGRHASAAREIAVECFDAKRVLARLIEQLG